MPELDVYFQNKKVGILREKNSRLTFKYLPEATDAISVNLPLQEGFFDDRATRGFFDNLLPEGDMREAVARLKQVSSRNPYALLKEIGGECAGAVALYPQGEKPFVDEDILNQISEEKIADILHKQAMQPLLTGENIRLSLAGAQQKMAVFMLPKFGRKPSIYLPNDKYVSTHIIKPQSLYFPNIIFNEYFCMKLARAVGLSAACSSIMRFNAVDAYVVRRFDRIYNIRNRNIKRIHQEDFCQGLGLSNRKYQKEGGPSIKLCFNFIKDKDFDKKVYCQISLLKTVIFNFVIGNSDAHGKNFSFLHTEDGYILSPLYDLVSTQVYEALSTDMAMSIGGEYNPDKITKSNFVALAKDLKISAHILLKYVDDIVVSVQKAVPTLLQQFYDKGLNIPEIEKLSEIINKRIYQLKD